mgnify:FL=1
MKKNLIVLLLLTALLIPTSIFAQDMEIDPNQPADPSLEKNNEQQGKVVAEVNDEEIYQEELSQKANINQLLQQINQIDQGFTQLLVNSEEGNNLLQSYERQQLDSLINQTLLVQEVEEQNISLSSSEADKFYQQQKEAVLNNNNLSEEEFQKALNNQGFESEEEYKEELMSNPRFKINKLIEEEIAADVDVSDEELRNEYENTKERFQNQGEQLSFEEVKPQLEKMMVQQKQSQQVNQYIEDLREEADIEINI